MIEWVDCHSYDDVDCGAEPERLEDSGAAIRNEGYLFQAPFDCISVLTRRCNASWRGGQYRDMTDTRIFSSVWLRRREHDV
jgi:hypothetical protein